MNMCIKNKKVFKHLCVLLVYLVFLQSNFVYVFAVNESTGVELNQKYVDISGHWAQDCIQDMIDKGFIKGVQINGKWYVEPERNMTRAELVVLLARVFKFSNDTNKKPVNFKDVKDNDWFKSALDIISSYGVVSGYEDGRFKPDANITRAEVSKIIICILKGVDIGENIAKLPTIPQFSDVKKTEWYYKYVMLCKMIELIKGYQDNTFHPNSYIKRAEVFTVISRLIQKITNKELNLSEGITLDVKPTNIPSNTPALTPSLTPTPTPESVFEKTYGSKDDDGDGVNKFMEYVLKTRDDMIDTDGDGLSDFVEAKMQGYCDPLKKDTDKDGVLDIDEDSDLDGLSNRFEVQFGTDPIRKDTDGDGLTDIEEITNTNTDPRYADTDWDGIRDDDELLLGLNPKNADTDGDGIEDKDEKINQNYSYKTNNQENDGIKEIIINGDVCGNLSKQITVKDTLENNYLSREIAGRVSDSFMIEISAVHDGLNISFEVSNSVLQNYNLKDLGVVEYNNTEHKIRYIDPSYNIAKNVISINISEPYEYIIVNTKAWFDAWKPELAENLPGKPDSDGDGLSDELEANGIRNISGNMVVTNPFKADSDGDGLTDLNEVGEFYEEDLPQEQVEKYGISKYRYYLFKSDPKKLDTDNDGDLDSTDLYSFDAYKGGSFILSKSYLENYIRKNNISGVVEKALRKINQYSYDKKIFSSYNRSFIFMFEGAGNYLNRLNQPLTHPKGRYGALTVVVRDGEIKFITGNSSTLPDNPGGTSNISYDGNVATVKNGVYYYISGLHFTETNFIRNADGSIRENGKYPALHIVNDNWEYKVISECIDNTGSITGIKGKKYDRYAYGINFHKGCARYAMYDFNVEYSVGCLTMLNEDFSEFSKAVGFTKNGSAEAGDPAYIVSGVIIIDRTMMN